MLMGYPLSDVILHRFDHFLFELFELVELQKGTEKVREQEGKERVMISKSTVFPCNPELIPCLSCTSSTL